MNITPSQTKVSNMLKDLYEINEEIKSTLLIGEKVAMIQETGYLYNHLKALITPEYLSDEEYDWLKETANEWNEEVLAFARSQNDGEPPVQSNNPLKELEEQINDMLDDMMDGNEPPQDNGGFDGGDGIY